MAVAFDAVSQGTGTTSVSFTHTPVGTPKGVLILVAEDNNNSSGITVSYGGTSVSAVAGSPVRFDTTNDSSVYGYFLGSSIPTGAQTVQVTGDNFARLVTCITVTATGDTTFVDSSTSTTTTPDPSVSLTLGGAVSFAALVAAVGGATLVSQVTPLSGWTSRSEALLGTTVVGAIYTYNTIGSTDVTAGITTNFSASLLGVAITDSEAGTDYTLTADQGSFTYTGQAATLIAGGGLTAEQGSYSLLGSEAAVDIEMDAVQGAYALSGQAADIENPKTLDADHGAYSLVGQNTALSYSGAVIAAVEYIVRNVRRVMRRGWSHFGRF